MQTIVIIKLMINWHTAIDTCLYVNNLQIPESKPQCVCILATENVP